MKIDKIYLDDAKRIRLEYLSNVNYITTKEKEMEVYIREINKIKNDVDLAVDNNITDDQFYQKKMKKLNENIDKLKIHVEHYYKNVLELDKDQRSLYHKIREKYRDITDDEIKKQVLEYILPYEDKYIENIKKLKEKGVI